MKEWCRQSIDALIHAILILFIIFFGLKIVSTGNTVKSAVNVDITQQNNITHGTVTYPNNANVKIETKNGQTIIVVK